MKYEALIDSVKQSIATGISNPMRIVERTFLLEMISARKDPGPEYLPLSGLSFLKKAQAILINIWKFLAYIFTSAYFNFILLLCGAVIMVLVIIAMISFFLNQIILPDPTQYVNDRGTLVFDQPLATEHYMFLLNTSELWADSGIGVVKGDKVEITVSGAFYSDIADLNKKSKENGSLLYSYFHGPNQASETQPYVLCPEKPFGSLLYRIERPATESLPLDYAPPINEIGNDGINEVSFVAPSSGILHFAVNDIVLDEHKLKTLVDNNVMKDKSLNYDEIIKNFEGYPEEMAKMWFQDNCGELLINVKVSRNLAKKSEIPFYERFFIYLMRLFPSS